MNVKSLTSFLFSEPVCRQNIWHRSQRKRAERDLIWWLMLSGKLAVLQAQMFDGLSLAPFALLDDVWSPAEVGFGGRHVAQRFVVTLVVVELDERLDLGLEFAWQEVDLPQDAVFQCLVSALDLALVLWVMGRPARGSSCWPQYIPPVFPRCRWGHCR